MDNTIEELKEIKVMYLSTPEGPSKAASLFFQLENIIGLRGRKFYGVFWPNSGEYWAATKIKENDDPGSLGLKTGVIPGGLYVCKILKGKYRDLLRVIAPTFERLSQQYSVDSKRPSIEYYKSFTEFALYLPIVK